MATVSVGQQPSSVREFKRGDIGRSSDLPSGRLRSRIERLPGHARERAIAWMGNLHFTDLDLESLQVDAFGGIYYSDIFALNAPGIEPKSDPPLGEGAVPVSPFPGSLVFHSRQGAPNVLFLNFAGENVTGTAWNSSLNRSTIPALPFSKDSDSSTFSDAEQLAVKRIWQRVAEDFAPFDIDVTTERPDTFGRRTAHALITRNTDADGADNPSATSGGVAYVGVFGSTSYSNYRPAWIYANNLGGDESYIAEAASHEVGHNLGLSHDGTIGGSEYYGGHGSGDTSWGPIMGTGYNRNVSQWSKGEYYQANNTQDDLATIASRLSYRSDDHGDSRATASSLIITGGTNILSTTPDTDPTNQDPRNKGVLDTNTDVDVFSFATGTGMIQLSVNPWISPSGRTRGGNLDLLLELYDSSGVLVLSDNPGDQTVAALQGVVDEGVYHLQVKNSGTGDPFGTFPTGFTHYGSIGQYFVSGYVVPSDLVIPPTSVLSVADLVAPGQGAHSLTVEYADNLAVSAATLDGDDILVNGPNGYSQIARFISKSSTADTSPISANYQIDPPDGVSWTEADNGTYHVKLRTNQISDTEGAWAAAGPLGEFNITIPRRIYFADLDGSPGWTLEPLWQYGVPGYSSGGPTSGYTGESVIAYNLAGDYQSRLDPVYATSPAIDCSNVESATLRFQRWLRLKNGDTATIEVSTNNVDWLEVWANTRSVSDNGWREVQYALPVFVAGSPNVRIRWGMGSGPARNDIGWNIDDVEVLGNGNLDTSPPTATLNIANITTGGSPTHEFSVVYSDDVAVDVARLGAGDLLVTGPNSFSNVVDFVGVDQPSNGAVRTATYSIPAPAGTWASTDNGTYSVTLLASEVADTGGNFTDEALLGQFTVAVSTSQQRLLVNATFLSIAEGGIGTLTIQLEEQPSADVVVRTAQISGDTDIVIESGAINVFTTSNWSVPVPVVFRALPDADQEDGSSAFEFQSEGLASVAVLLTEEDTTPDSVLAVVSNDSNWGSVTPDAGVFAVGTLVNITATPFTHFEFVGWSGDATGTNNPLTVFMEADVNIVAEFTELVAATYGTPHWWLTSFGQTGDFDAAELTVGQNGIPLWQSYVAGLDPTDPNSQFRLQVVQGLAENSVVLEWDPATDRFYSLFQSTNFTTGFSPLPGGENLPSTIQSYTNTSSDISPLIFYRLEVTKP